MMFRLVFRILPAIFLAVAWPPLSAEDRDPLLIRHADGFEYLNRNGVKVQKLTGRVEIEYQKTVIRSDTAIHYHTLDRIEFFDNVRLLSGAQNLTSDRLVYYKKDSSAIARGHVVISDSAERVRITGGEGRYARDKETSRIWDKPVLRRIDSAQGETLTIVSRELEHYGRDKRAVAIDSVVITQGKTRALCGRAVYDQATGSLRLLKEPVVYYEKDVMTGDTIDLFFRRDTLDRIVVTGRASGEFAETEVKNPDSAKISRLKGDTVTAYLTERKVRRLTAARHAEGFSFYKTDLSQVDRLSGRFMEFFFTDNRADSIRVFDDAVSVYHYTDEKGGPGRNEVSGDTLNLFFSDGKMARILARGGIKGAWYGR